MLRSDTVKRLQHVQRLPKLNAQSGESDQMGSSHHCLSDQIYEVLALLSNELFRPISVGEESSATKPLVALAGAKQQENLVLSFGRLEFYMETVPLPGSERPLGKGHVESVLRMLQRDVRGEVSRDHFRLWFDGSSSRKGLAELNERTIFARLLSEEMDEVIAWSMDHSGAALTADMAGDEDEKEEADEKRGLSKESSTRSVNVGKQSLFTRQQTTASVSLERHEKRTKMAKLWDQRTGRAAHRKDSVRVLNKSASKHLGLSDRNDTFRARYLEHLKSNASMGASRTVAALPSIAEAPPSADKLSIRKPHIPQTAPPIVDHDDVATGEYTADAIFLVDCLF